MSCAMKKTVFRKAVSLSLCLSMVLLLAGALIPAKTVEAAKKVKVKVVKSIDADGTVTKFTYDSKTGLLKKQKSKGAGNTYTYGYDKNGKLVKVKGGMTVKYTLDKSGKAVSGKAKNSVMTTEEKFSYKSGKLSSYTHNSITEMSSEYDTDALTWKNGRIKSKKSTMVIDYSEPGMSKETYSGTVSYTYDKNGNRKSEKGKSVYGSKVKNSYKNKYDGKNLVQQTVSGTDGKKVLKFTYDTVEVDSKYVTRIQKQRSLILLDELWRLPTV